MEINLNITIGESFFNTVIPIEEDIIMIDFIFSLQAFLSKLYENTSTYDIYDTSFNRIALVGADEQIYIDKKYQNINSVYQLLENNIDTLEIIALSNNSVSKILQEEAFLQKALDEYEI